MQLTGKKNLGLDTILLSLPREREPEIHSPISKVKFSLVWPQTDR